jgi:hypothetical protein
VLSSRCTSRAIPSLPIVACCDRLTRLAFGRLALTAILTGACEPAEFPGKHQYSIDQTVILRLSVSQYVPLAYPVTHLIERFVVPWVFDRSTVPPWWDPNRSGSLSPRPVGGIVRGTRPGPLRVGSA